MIKTGILNPQINSLISRVRHTNTLVIADRGFPFWPEIETVDISLVDDVPTVVEVLQALRSNFVFGRAWMAREFLKSNDARTRSRFAAGLHGIAVSMSPMFSLNGACRGPSGSSARGTRFNTQTSSWRALRK